MIATSPCAQLYASSTEHQNLRTRNRKRLNLTSQMKYEMSTDKNTDNKNIYLDFIISFTTEAYQRIHADVQLCVHSVEARTIRKLIVMPTLTVSIVEGITHAIHKAVMSYLNIKEITQVQFERNISFGGARHILDRQAVPGATSAVRSGTSCTKVTASAESRATQYRRCPCKPSYLTVWPNSLFDGNR